MSIGHNATDFELRTLQGRQGLQDFLQVPAQLYAHDPCWIPPLNFERKDALSPKAAFFQHAQWQGWIAFQNGKPVARISAQIDALYAEQHGEAVGYFGMFECPDDQDLAGLLFTAAETWLRERGISKIQGPFNLGVNQELGLLVDGFKTPPYFMMPHGLPYYEKLVTSCGYHSVQDLLAYVMDPEFTNPPVMQALLDRLAPKVSLRNVNPKAVDADLECLRDIFNDAWSENWGFVPFTKEEFNAVGREMLLIIPDEFIQIAELDGEAVAFIVLLPNLNEAIADLGGRLLPFGWAKLLWRLKVKYPSTGRVPLMGVRKKLHHTRLGPGLAFVVIDAIRAVAIKAGIREIEMSWILDDNMGMRNIIESIGGKISKRYRMYAKDL